MNGRSCRGQGVTLASRTATAGMMARPPPIPASLRLCARGAWTRAWRLARPGWRRYGEDMACGGSRAGSMAWAGRGLGGRPMGPVDDLADRAGGRSRPGGRRAGGVACGIAFVLIPWVTLGWGSAAAFVLAAAWISRLRKPAARALWISAAVYTAVLVAGVSLRGLAHGAVLDA